jgi:Spy/CpxP family protein refolding chaperone
LTGNQHKFFTFVSYNNFKSEEKFLENQLSKKRRYTMNSNLRQKLFTGAMVLLVTVCFIPGSAGAFTPGHCKPEKGFGMKRHHLSPLGIWRNPKMVQELGLTDEQVKGLRETDFAHREKRLQLKSKLDGLHLELEKLFSADPLNESDILQLAQKISDIKGKLFVRRIESRLAVGKLLTADQLKNLKIFELHHRARHGKTHGKDKHCRRNLPEIEGAY